MTSLSSPLGGRGEGMVTSGFSPLGGGATLTSTFSPCANEVKVGMPHSWKGRASGHSKKEEKVDMASPFREEAEVEAMVTFSFTSLRRGATPTSSFLSCGKGYDIAMTPISPSERQGRMAVETSLPSLAGRRRRPRPHPPPF